MFTMDDVYARADDTRDFFDTCGYVVVRNVFTPAEVRDAVRAIAAARPICSASLAAYDPSVDPEGRTLEVGLQLIDLFADLAAAPRRSG